MEQSILLWTLIIMRVSGFVLVNPILSRRGIPGIVKSGIIMALSIFLISYGGDQTVAAAGMVEYVFLLLKECPEDFFYKIPRVLLKALL